MASLHPSLERIIGRFEKPQNKVLKYGTAGFRDEASLLDSTMIRMGLLAALRSCKTNGAVIGVVVTASHNPEQDNGAKIVDPDGGMLTRSFEQHCEALANAPTGKIVDTIQAIIEKEHIDINVRPTVFVARDTRKSSSHLCELVRDGALSMKANVMDFGEMTTPQLHHCVKYYNLSSEAKDSEEAEQFKNWACEEGYFKKVESKFCELIGDNEFSPSRLIIDGANGIGASKAFKLRDIFPSLNIEVRNVGSGRLNHHCGAEFLQKKRLIPQEFSADNVGPEDRCCAYDGDADRIVYFRFNDEGAMEIIDGDRIAVVYTLFLRELLQKANLEKSVNLGVVQTSYANGSSSRFMKEQDFEIGIAKTGVKFVHHKALEYDIGVYFEANGHGTVVFRDETVDCIKEVIKTGNKSEADAAQKLLLCSELINQAVGDAMACMLLFEAILITKKWTLADIMGFYTEVPSFQAVVKVADRAIVVPNDNETALEEPAELVAELERLCAEYEFGRVNVRPSGTEDVVRVYVEAGCLPDTVPAREFGIKVADAIHKFAQGVGEKPSSFL
eukprot:TRINITY_DN777886_c0_g1_i1.p1 TRINITY_DN777886_c0_g1~~TRINITY_DN777886_c0_g1_i1.p1  ORF type:complete len:558 (+),score=202.79 TRINITY_DN777886_c0_g1_i1:28-1701(+)